MIPVVENDYEKRVVDTARRLLDHIPECARADFKVRWLDMVGVVPVLIVAFNLPELVHQPACAVRLASVSRSTGANTLLEGERLRHHIESSIEHYLNKHGIRIPFDPN